MKTAQAAMPPVLVNLAAPRVVPAIPATAQPAAETAVHPPHSRAIPQEKQEYTLYRFYWYNTNTWEESRDANRFQEWSRSSNGQLYPLRHPFARPEDNPLFLEYDGNGNPVYTNDHTILSNLYEWVPCEPHMEYETVTVEVKVTRCTICGAIRE